MSRVLSRYGYAGRAFRDLCAVAVLAPVVVSSASAQNANRTSKDGPAAGKIVATVTRGSIPTPVLRHEAKFVQSLAPELPMRITLVLLPPKRAQLEKLVAQITNPKSPHYRLFLTFQQWKEEYAPHDSDVSAVADWAKGVGLGEVYRFPTNTAIVVQGSVATVQTALGVQLSEYVINGHHFFANNRRPALPQAIAARIDTVLGLNSFEQMHGRAFVDLPAPRVPGGAFVSRSQSHRDARPRNTITGPLGGSVLEPPDLWSSQAYDYNALFRLSNCCNPTNLPTGSPKEASIAIVGHDSPSDSDWQTFFTTYGLAWNITQVIFSGASCCEDEVTLDIEWAGAMSNSRGSFKQTAHLFVYEGSGHTLDTAITVLSAAFADDNARILSDSYGTYEDSYGGVGAPSISAFRDVTNGMIATGWTLVVATGDRGAFADCSNLSVYYPASDPNVIAVGGTTLSLSRAGAGLAFKGESAFSGNGCSGPGGNGGGGGGGCSNTFFAPWWSSSFGQCPGGRRAIPDLSLNASSPQAFFYLGQWSSRGGTSISTPELAGFFAHAASYLIFIEQGAGRCSNGINGRCLPIGHPGPAFFLGGTRPFYDVRDGSCNGGGPGNGFCTTPGYDLATGLGSANMLQLAWSINRWLWGQDEFSPNVAFNGPPLNNWYATDQQITFTISGGTMGIAGFTAQWDSDPGDPVHATPGSGDPYWDGPSVPFGSSGSLSLAAAGPGCHTAFVRAWDNLGNVSVSAPYGPVCFGAPPNCSISFSCLVHDDNPPQYTVQCQKQEDFDLVFQDGFQQPLGTHMTYSDTSSLYGEIVLACDSGTNNCARFSIEVSQDQWCKPQGPQPPPRPPICKACIEAGGTCVGKRCVF